MLSEPLNVDSCNVGTPAVIICWQYNYVTLALAVDSHAKLYAFANWNLAANSWSFANSQDCLRRCYNDLASLRTSRNCQMLTPC